MKSIIYIFTLLFKIGVSASRAQTNEDFESSNITENTIVASSFINDDEGWLADNTGIIWHTSNAGQSWASISSGNYFLKLNFTDATHGYALSLDAAFKTSDGGSTWSTLSLPGTLGYALNFQSNSTGFISGNETTYKTTDGGNTWTSIPTEGVSFVDYFFVDDSTGIAAAYDEDNYQCIWRTTNGGTSWSNVYSVTDYFVTSIWFTDENSGWAAGYYTLFGRGNLPIINHTTDGGITWENVYTNLHPGDIKGEILLDIRFRNEEEGFAMSSNSENVITSDGGSTWNLTYGDEGDLVPSYGIYKTLDGYNDMYLAGKQGYVTKWE